MHELAKRLYRIGVAAGIVLAGAYPAHAAGLTIVDVPQGMILQSHLTRTGAAPARNGAPIAFVVTHDLRIGTYVVIPAGSRGAGHLVRAARPSTSNAAPRIACDYVLASDGTRIPVSGSFPYLVTRASRAVVIYDVDDDPPRAPGLPLGAGADAALARP